MRPIEDTYSGSERMKLLALDKEIGDIELLIYSLAKSYSHEKTQAKEQEIELLYAEMWLKTREFLQIRV